MPRILSFIPGPPEGVQNEVKEATDFAYSDIIPVEYHQLFDCVLTCDGILFYLAVSLNILHTLYVDSQFESKLPGKH